MEPRPQLPPLSRISLRFADDLAERYALVDPAQAARPEGVTRYVVGREIARGGMGAILEAWDRDLDRPLAMKVVLERSRYESTTTEQLLQRFVREARITGQLDHPGVVPVHELGVDDDGRVFFTMRLVRGRDLEKVFSLAGSEEDGWNLTRVLEVLLRVCDTVAFAHSRGIIHRDLKPTNIMVGDYGEVYVMDWGLARVLPTAEGEETESRADLMEDVPPLDAESTRHGAVLGTPAYMPPEQARGDLEDIGPWSDVYSVGAMLYTLLSGCPPYSVGGKKRRGTPGGHEIVQRVKDGPPHPVLALAPETPLPLAEICDRAMAREPDARYASTDAMARELRDFLEMERKAAQAADRARAEAHQAKHVSDFLTGLFQIASPSEAKAKGLTVLELLERGVARLEEEPGDPPVLRSNLYHTLGGLYESLGMHAEALPLLEKALELRRSTDEEDDADLATNLNDVAAVRCELGRYSEAEPLYRQALAIRRGAVGQRDAGVAETLTDLGACLMYQARYDEAEPAFQESLAIRRDLFGEEHPLVATTLNDLGLLAREQGRLEEAEQLYRRTLELRRRILPAAHPQIATSLNNLGGLLVVRAQYSEAEPLYREAIEIRRSVLGEDHPELVISINMLAVLLYHRGDYDEAEERFREALEFRRRLLGPDHPHVANCLYNLAAVVRDRDQLEEAEALFRDAKAIYDKCYADGHPIRGMGASGLASVLGPQGRREEARDLFESALQVQRAKLPPRHSRTADTLLAYGELLTETAESEADVERAEELLREAAAIYADAFPEDHPRVADAESALGAILTRKGERREAEALLRRSESKQLRCRRESHRAVRRCRARRAALRDLD